MDTPDALSLGESISGNLTMNKTGELVWVFSISPGLALFKERTKNGHNVLRESRLPRNRR